MTSNPNRYSLEPGEVAHLRGAPAVVLRNAYNSESKMPIKFGATTLTFDRKEMTDTAIAMLGRALEKQATANTAPKAIVLRVRPTNFRVHGVAPVMTRTVTLFLDFRLGDGTTGSLEAKNASPADFDRVLDGAILFALRDFVKDERFVAYMNRDGNACLPADTYVQGERLIVGERLVEIRRIVSEAKDCSNPNAPIRVDAVIVPADKAQDAVFSHCVWASAQVGDKLMIGLYAATAAPATIQRVLGPSPRCTDPQRNPTRVEARFEAAP